MYNQRDTFRDKGILRGIEIYTGKRTAICSLYFYHSYSTRVRKKSIGCKEAFSLSLSRFLPSLIIVVENKWLKSRLTVSRSIPSFFHGARGSDPLYSSENRKKTGTARQSRTPDQMYSLDVPPKEHVAWLRTAAIVATMRNASGSPLATIKMKNRYLSSRINVYFSSLPKFQDFFAIFLFIQSRTYRRFKNFETKESLKITIFRGSSKD